MVHVEMDTFEEEVLMPKLQCESPIARRLEADLYRNFMNITEFDDDWVTPNFFGIRWKAGSILWAMKLPPILPQIPAAELLDISSILSLRTWRTTGTSWGKQSLV